MSVQVRVGGIWLSTIGAWGELTWSHAADGGCKEASWRMDLPPTYSHPALARGQIVEIKQGPWNVWSGLLAQPDMDDDWTFTAVGVSTTLDNGALSFDGSLNVSFTPDTAIDRAITAGFPLTRPASLSASAYQPTTTTDSILYLGALLDDWANSAGKRWGVDADRHIYAAADPTIPTWHLTPGSGRFGLADDEYASDLFLRYVASGGSYATTSVSDAVSRAKFGRREYAVDITSLGVLTAGAAQAVGNGLLAKGTARLGWTNGVEATKWQLTTPGGAPASLALVRGQQLVRMFGVLDERGQPVPYVDWVIGETSYEAGADTIGLTPTGLVARTLTDVLSLGAV